MLPFLKSRRGQIFAQIFIYIIAITLFSFVLLYGYNAIKGFKERSDTISYIKFKTSLASTVKRISPDYGTLKREELFVGGDYDRVCFVQNYKQEENLAKILAAVTDEIVRDSVEDGDKSNVFLFEGAAPEALEIGIINLSNHYKCILV